MNSGRGTVPLGAGEFSHRDGFCAFDLQLKTQQTEIHGKENYLGTTAGFFSPPEVARVCGPGRFGQFCIGQEIFPAERGKGARGLRDEPSPFPSPCSHHIYCK